MLRANIDEIIRFVVKPTLDRNKMSLSGRLGNVMVLLVLKILVSAFLALVISALSDLENIGIEQAKENYALVELLVAGALFLPIVEETMFRLGLIFSPVNWAIAVGVICYYLISRSYFDVSISDLENHLLFRVGVSLLIGIVMFALFHLKRSRLMRFSGRNLRLLFYLSVVVFAAAHVSNFDTTTANFFDTLLIISPHLVGGIFLGFIRVKYGFLIGLGFHSVNNFLGILYLS